MRAQRNRMIMQKGKVLLGLLAAAVGLAGCRVPKHVPVLTQRSVVEVRLVVETEPPGARVFTEDLRCIGEAPAGQRWEIEHLTWSDGETTFRMLPEGTRIKPGENLSVHLTVRAEGYEEKEAAVSISFSGREETVTRKITLEKK